MFVDKVTIKVQAGRGGDGKLSFRHMRNHKGGPDGGDGGRGGDVVLRADHNTASLYKYRSNKTWKAEDGAAGGTNRKHGKSAPALELIVPPGTVVSEEGQTVADLEHDGQIAVAARGGDGGFGNAHFTSSTRQAPRFAEVGEPGERKELTLELKMIAEVGLIGLPNAGKSTLLATISNARPEIANYPFTTLVPNLGVVDIRGTSRLFADIPGLIEGAAEGKGLGDEFLRHIERTRVLVHLIDAASANVVADYQTINTELAKYSRTLAKKPQLVALSKSDTVAETALQHRAQVLQKLGLQSGQKLFTISARAHRGVDALIDAVERELKKPVRKPKTKAVLPVITLADSPRLWQVQKQGSSFTILGAELEKLARRINFDQSEAVDRLRAILAARGVWREIERQGGGAGARVEIAGKKFRW